MILVKISKYLSSLLFCKRDLSLSFDDVVFSKGGFLDDKNDILLWSKNLHIVKGVNP